VKERGLCGQGQLDDLNIRKLCFICTVLIQNLALHDNYRDDMRT
jgi:hypothetical protein